jgi:hypothetical protein
MTSARLIRKRLRRRQARSTVAHLAARLGSLVARRRPQNLIPLAPFDEL